MTRTDLLNDIRYVLEGAGYMHSHSRTPFTYQINVRYPSEIEGKRDTAHFLVHTKNGTTIQIVAKFQEVNGTAIEKVAYSAVDARRTNFDHYIVICGGDKLVPCAIDYLNNHRDIAPKLKAMEVHELENFLSDLDSSYAA